MSKENMGRNAEHYADPTPTAAIFAIAIWRLEMAARGARSISRPVTMAMENAVSVFLPTGTFEEEK